MANFKVNISLCYKYLYNKPTDKYRGISNHQNGGNKELRILFALVCIHYVLA